MTDHKIIQPTYIAKLPSSGKSVNFRPFTVKEEKALLLALQEADSEIIVQAIKNVVSVCTYGEVNIDEAPYYDVEFIYLHIRSKSIGETVELTGSCECSEKAKTEFIVDMTNINVEPKPSGTLKIKVPGTIYSIELRHPSLDDFTRKFNNTEESGIEVVANCIVSVYTDLEVMDWTMKQKIEFVESMTSKQQTEIAQFLKDMPMVRIPFSYICQSCGSKHESALTGFSNFFL